MTLEICGWMTNFTPPCLAFTHTCTLMLETTQATLTNRLLKTGVNHQPNK